MHSEIFTALNPVEVVVVAAADWIIRVGRAAGANERTQQQASSKTNDENWKKKKDERWWKVEVEEGSFYLKIIERPTFSSVQTFS